MFKPIRFAVLLAGLTLAFSALAQPAPDDAAPPPPDQANPSNQADPPTRVARLAFMSGAVSFVPAGENDWVEAQLNRPLITGDKLWTDASSRASLEVGTSAIRMDQQTSFDFLNLDDQTAQMELTQGTLNLRVRRLYDGQVYEVDTPTLAFVVNRVGEFRIDVMPDGQSTVVTVFHGGGDVYGEGGARFSVDEGQSVTFNNPQLQNYQTSSLPPPDAFDAFCSQRDQRWDASSSRRYVSEDVIGYQDLDANGSWSDVPEYGNVWYPTSVQVGWSPYHYGHWGWVGAYGWTWIDDAAWGFAPFHYGRWAYIGNRWGWCPGPIGVRPYYAPALVAFVGGGVGIGFSVGGPIGWFALGPRDVYFPSYRVSRGYFANINSRNAVINNTVINNYYGNYSRGNVNYGQINYANRNIAGAVTAVPGAAFIGSRSVAGAAIAVNASTFANARVSGFAAVAPTRASLAPAIAARGRPAAAVMNRPIVAATRPPAPVASFAQRQAALDKNPGQPLSMSQLRAPAVAAGAVAGAAAVGIAARRNVNVVTSHGAPIRTAAPSLPARAGLNATNATSNARLTPSTSGTGTAHTATTGTTTTHLNSSSFAHPGVGPATTNNNKAGQSLPPKSLQRTTSTNPATHSTTSTVSKSNSTLSNTVRSNGNTGVNTRESTYNNHNTGKPASNPEYRRTTTAPTNTHATPQEYQRANPQVQHNTLPPAAHHNPPPPPKEKKDDDKKHDGH